MTTNSWLLLATISIISCLTIDQIDDLESDSHCYGLAIEGGGDAGAWEVGALKTVYSKYPVGY